MTREELLEYAPVLFHATFAGGWDALRVDGLLSTSAILDLCQVPPEERTLLETRRRPRSVTLALPSGRRVTIRDQKPLAESKVALQGGWTFEQLCRELNRRVFLFADRDRLHRLLSIYGAYEHDVLALSTASLLETAGERIELCRVNSGTTRYPGQRRGPDTFLPLDAFPWPSARSSRSLAEVTVLHSLGDLEHVVEGVTRFRGPVPVQTLFGTAWERLSGTHGGLGPDGAEGVEPRAALTERLDRSRCRLAVTITNAAQS